MGADPRAEELRQKLVEARDLAQERDEFESAETPVDRADPAEGDLRSRRGDVHERARATAEQMRRAASSGE